MSDLTDELNHETTKLSSSVVAHIWRPINGTNRAVVILQHGYCEYAQRYVTSHHNIVRYFIATGYIVYAMDLLGHGDSSGTRGVVHLGKAVQDHLELRKAVRAQNPKLSIILFGHSLGGLVTSGSTVANQADIKGVVLTGPAFPAPLPYLGRLAIGVAARAMPKTSVPVKANVEGLTRNADEIRKYWDDPGCHKDPVSFLLAATALDATQKVTAGAAKWKVPTLVLHGKADAYCDWKGSAKFVEGIASEDKQFETYDGGRHELLHDLEGDTVLARILDWIEHHV
jgi:acylglycerol lipase